ncbi:hypothetical protein GCM10007147_34520 [Nocardiopsis kunsanensis]|uniref:DUF2637 domain-containing protein n=1 Tax=Nocardiopsis kunsanensis TaxID=141693 RepID=A0A918XH74_9ACTN|nr:hypothetical protein GCM10007147_34520 [Nocardiopsis kunsanensis]
MDPSRWSRWTTMIPVLMPALIAAVVSYSHMYELVLCHGEPEWRAALFPLSVDGMFVASPMTLLSDARSGRKGGVLPWVLLIIGSGLPWWPTSRWRIRPCGRASSMPGRASR